MTNTERLDLFKVPSDPAEQETTNFNTETMMNENWEKIDKKVAVLGSDGKIPSDQIDIDTSNLATKQELQTVDNKVTTHSADYTQFKSDTESDIEDLQNDINNIELKAEKVELNSDKFDSTDVLGGMEELFTNVSDGKSLIGTAITDVDEDVDVPANPTFQQLVDAIERISIGREWAEGSGSLAWNEQTLSVNGLSFKPTIILAQAIGTHSGRELTVYAELTTLIINSKVPTSGNAGISDTKLYDDGFSLEISKGSSAKEVEWIAFE